jgi:hypothetical protein
MNSNELQSERLMYINMILLQTQIKLEAMKIENEKRLMNHEAIAYTEDNFMELYNDIGHNWFYNIIRGI